MVHYLTIIYIYMYHIYIYLTIIVYIYNMWSNRQRMCHHGQYQSANGLIVTPALGHIRYSYTLLVSMKQRALIIKKLVRVIHGK